VDFKGGNRGNKVYLLIALLVLILILVTVIISSNKIIPAYVDDVALGSNWYEDRDEAESPSSQLFGLEKHASFTYRPYNSSFPSFLTVNTYKTLFMTNEKDLYDKAVDYIDSEMKNRNVSLDYNSTVEGERTLKNGHKTMYVTYNGNFSKNSQTEKVKIVGETWNCERSGTSIIAIGFSQITNNSLNLNKVNLNYWTKIIEEDGLIFNIICH